jgi:hypothetical protein
VGTSLFFAPSTQPLNKPTEMEKEVGKDQKSFTSYYPLNLSKKQELGKTFSYLHICMASRRKFWEKKIPHK